MAQDLQIAKTIARSRISSWPQPVLPLTVVIGPPVRFSWVRIAPPSPNWLR